MRLRRPPNALIGGVLVATFAATGVAAATVGAREQVLAPLHDMVSSSPDHVAPRAAPTAVLRNRIAPATSGPMGARVAPLHRLVAPDFLVTLPTNIAPSFIIRTAHLAGVRSLEQVDMGTITVAGARVRALGVDPSSFRNWTPKPTGASDALWASVARNELTVSFDLAKEARLPLGSDVAVAGVHQKANPLRIGAFASMGLPDIDAVVTRTFGRTLGLTSGDALLVSAPKVDQQVMRTRLQRLLGARADVESLRQFVIVRDAGSFLTRQQIYVMLKTALAQVGKPYLWGGVGPASFDCSGLVGFAFHTAGVDMPRTAAQQWFAGPHVPPSDARPGDLLFWANDPTAPGFIDHVAIYLGNGMMVSAPHTGLFVHVAPVYTSNLMGVVRVDPAMSAAVGGPHWPA